MSATNNAFNGEEIRKTIQKITIPNSMTKTSSGFVKNSELCKEETLPEKRRIKNGYTNNPTPINRIKKSSLEFVFCCLIL